MVGVPRHRDSRNKSISCGRGLRAVLEDKTPNEIERSLPRHRLDIVGRQVFCVEGGSEQYFGTKYETKQIVGVPRHRYSRNTSISCFWD